MPPSPLIPAALLMGAIQAAGSPRLRERIIRLVSYGAYRASAEKRLTNRRAIRHFLGNSLNERHLEQLVRGTFRNLWRDVFECVLFDADRKRLDAIEISGLELLREHLERKRGCILWESNNFGRRNLAKQVLAREGFPVDQVHLEQHFLGLGRTESISPLEMRSGCRLEQVERGFVREIHTIPLDGSFGYARHLLTVLRGNGLVCSAADGRRGRRHLLVDFLEGKAQIATGMLSLSKILKTPILSILAFRREDGSHCVEIQEVLPESGGEEKWQEAAQAHARYLEARVLRFPGQYSRWPALRRES